MPLSASPKNTKSELIGFFSSQSLSCWAPNKRVVNLIFSRSFGLIGQGNWWHKCTDCEEVILTTAPPCQLLADGCKAFSHCRKLSYLSSASLLSVIKKIKNRETQCIKLKSIFVRVSPQILRQYLLKNVVFSFRPLFVCLNPHLRTEM